MSPDEIRDVVERRFLTALLETLVDWPQIDVPRFVEAVTRRAIEARKVEQPAPAAPVTDAEIEAAIEAHADRWNAHGYLDGRDIGSVEDKRLEAKEETAKLRALIARLQQANAAAEDLRREVVALRCRPQTTPACELDVRWQGLVRDRDEMLARAQRAERSAEDLARAVETLFASRVCSDEFEIERVRDLEDALAAFRKAQGGGK